MTGALKDRVALVTGGGRGIGHAVALALGREGARVVVSGRRQDGLEAVRAAIEAAGASGALTCHLDVADPGGIDAALERLGEAGLAVDVLVNNAGIAESAPIARTDLALWQRHLAVNATGPFLLSRALLPGMLERRWGRIINIASTAGLEGGAYITAYTASKHALVGLTRALAVETRGTGVTVNAICPGFAATDLVWESARRIEQKTGKSFEDAVQALARLNPSGRLIEPAEVAAAVVMLSRQSAGGRTGETVVIA
jgi:NAD(P)-dependent dehydrogenase (short-subunit alcohol dehydrogenase family)